MKYSDAFEQLHEMSLDIEWISKVKYERIAMFIERVMMVADGRNLPWDERFIGFKKKIFPHVIRLTDFEWVIIHEAIMQYVERSQGSPQWKTTRIEWVRALDTMREFERE